MSTKYEQKLEAQNEHLQEVIEKLNKRNKILEDYIGPQRTFTAKIVLTIDDKFNSPWPQTWEISGNTFENMMKQFKTFKQEITTVMGEHYWNLTTKIKKHISPDKEGQKIKIIAYDDEEETVEVSFIFLEMESV